MILLTGSSGFIGSELYKQLRLLNIDTVPLVRSINSKTPKSAYSIGDINGETNYGNLLRGVNTVIHVAARAHIVNGGGVDSFAEFRRINTEGTLNLAYQAAKSGVQRFIFISSIGVHGDNSKRPFNESDPVNPQNPYSISKLEAEIGLKEIAKAIGMDVVIIRPPLVYGGNAPGNFGKLIRLLDKQLPLPLSLINNKRSMLYLGNLVDFIIFSIDHPKAANETFLISDGHDVSLNALARMIRYNMNKSAWLFPVPLFLFRLVGNLTGKMEIVDRLIGDLQVDNSKAIQLLNWTPPYTVEQGIADTVNVFTNRKK